MNAGRPYVKMWRWVWVSFCKIAIVLFFSFSVPTVHNCTYELGQSCGEVTVEVNMVRVF